MPTIPQLEWATMTAVVNEIKTPNRLVRDTLFSAEDPQSTESINYDLLTGDRKSAPFVSKNSKGIMVEGYGEKFQAIEPPNIRITRPLTAAQAFFARTPGSPVFIGTGDQTSEINKKIARDLRRLVEMRDNAIEWLACQALRGSIAYQIDEQASFKITFPRSNSHSITLSTFWDQPNSTPSDDILTAMELVSADADLPVTDAFLGSEASRVFSKHTQLLGLLDTRNVLLGSIDLTRQYSEKGALYLGTIRGVRFWGYNRKANVNGAEEDLIRAKYAEFVSATPAAENVLYYGAIADWDAFNGQAWATPSFSKSWIEKDPSVYMSLLASRPLPVMRRPDSTVSMKVVSG